MLKETFFYNFQYRVFFLFRIWSLLLARRRHAVNQITPTIPLGCPQHYVPFTGDDQRCDDQHVHRQRSHTQKTLPDGLEHLQQETR